MDIVTYALCKKIATGAVSGIQSYRVEDLNFIMTTNDGQELKITFPSPIPKEIDIDENNYLIFTMEDNSIIKSQNPIPKIKVSKKDGNVLIEELDGLYVPAGNVEVSREEGNMIELKNDGIYTAFSADNKIVENTVLKIINTNKETENIDFSDFFE